MINNELLLITKKWVPHQGLVLWCAFLYAPCALEVADVLLYTSVPPIALRLEYQLFSGEFLTNFCILCIYKYDPRNYSVLGPWTIVTKRVVVIRALISYKRFITHWGLFLLPHVLKEEYKFITQIRNRKH